MNAITALLINNRNLRKKLQLSKIMLPHYLFLIQIIVDKGYACSVLRSKSGNEAS